MTSESQQLRIKFNKPQRFAFRHFQDGNVVVLPWGRGIGKSEFMLLCMFLLVAMHEYKRRPGMPHDGVRIVFLMPALSQARKGILPRFRAKLGTTWAFLGGSMNEVELVCRFPGGSYIQFVSQEQREFLRSLRCDAVFADEGDDIDREVYASVVSPWFSEPFSLARRMIGGTPMLGRKGLLFELLSLATSGFQNHYGKRATWRDAPEHVKQSFVEGERAKAERNGTMAAFLREYECDFDSAEGLVYPMFCDLHVAEPWTGIAPTEVIVGVDHGWEDPGVFVVCHVYGSGSEAIVHVVEEVYEPHREETWWVQKARSIKERYPKARWYADPSQPARIEALRRQASINIVGAENAREDGISAVADRFAIRLNGEGERYTRMKISPTCARTLSEIGTYHYKRDPRNRERHIDAVDDRDDHAMDALRYAVFSRFGKPAPIRQDAGNFDSL